MKNSILQEMGGDIRQIDRTAEAKRLISKWERTGLLEGLMDTPNSKRKSNMAVLLENQASFNVFKLLDRKLEAALILLLPVVASLIPGQSRRAWARQRAAPETRRSSGRARPAP